MSSYEKTGKSIKQYSTQSGLDMLHFFQMVVFSFITGKADMHLKNFSLLEYENDAFCLSPAYDLVSTTLVIKNETEQMALSVNGRKNKITKSDFVALGKSLFLSDKQIKNCFDLFLKKLTPALWWINQCFLNDEQKKD